MKLILGDSSEKPILDACCGGRMFWFNKQNKSAVFMDIRTETHELSNGTTLVVDPDVIADFRQMQNRYALECLGEL